jgi:hypothetical protein
MMELKMRDADEAARLVIEIASALIRKMQSKQTPWSRAFIRFEMPASNSWGCSGSYETQDGVNLFNAFSDGRDIFATVNDIGPKLRQAVSSPEHEVIVILVSVDSNFDYKVDFESNDPNRWKITKLDNATGLPEGIH